MRNFSSVVNQLRENFHRRNFRFGEVASKIMNEQTQILSDAGEKVVRRTCPKCGYVRETAETKCSVCGKTLQSVAKIRLSGVFLVILGTALFAFMSWLSLWMLDRAAQSGRADAAGKFTGDFKDAGFIIFVFGLVMSICLGAAAAGIWQIIFGKRNKLLALLVLILGLVFMGTGLTLKLR